MNLNPPDEHQLLVFWVGLLVLLATARLLGLVAQRFGQPAVIGELSAGLVLGPSLLGRVAPDVFEWLFPPDDAQTAMLFTVGWLGVVFLLVVTGEETDLGLIRRLGRAAGVVSTGSLVVPLAAGLVVGSLMPELFLGEQNDRTVFALFLAAALSISSLPVIAKILSEMGFMRRNFGQLTLAAGMANDVIGWIILGVVAGLAQAGAIEIGALVKTLAGLTIFFLLAFTLGQRLLDIGLRQIRLRNSAGHAATGLVVVFALALGSATQWLGVEAVLGAFVAGILVGRSRFRDEHIIEPIESVTSSFLAPIFFATAGLRVDLGLLGDPEVLTWAAVVIVVASLAKFLGSVAAGRIAGLPGREGMALGVGLNARGALEIVIATVGLSLDVLNQTSYTIIVVMAMATSMAAPPLLRRVLAGWEGTDEERQRLQKEEALQSNVVVRNERVLLPTRGGLNSIMAAQIVDLAWPKDVPVSLATGEDTDADLAILRDVLYDRSVERRLLQGSGTVDEIVEELGLGYGAVVLGATHDGDAMVSPFAEELIRRSPVPALLVRRGPSVRSRLPSAYGRVLVPIAGTRSSRAAQEIGLAISAAIGTEAVLAHVARPDDDAAGRGLGRVALDLLPRARPADDIGRRLLEEAAASASRLGARAITATTESASPATGILELADAHGTDLVVLGATRRAVDGHLFLGHTVERILDRCDATIVVVVTPADRGATASANGASNGATNSPANGSSTGTN